MYTIEKGIPFDDQRKRKSELAIFMDTLEVGDIVYWKKISGLPKDSKFRGSLTK